MEVFAQLWPMLDITQHCFRNAYTHIYITAIHTALYKPDTHLFKHLLNAIELWQLPSRVGLPSVRVAPRVWDVNTVSSVCFSISSTCRHNCSHPVLCVTGTLNHTHTHWCRDPQTYCKYICGQIYVIFTHTPWHLHPMYTQMYIKQPPQHKQTYTNILYMYVYI